MTDERDTIRTASQRQSGGTARAMLGFGAAIFQILLLDMVFSIDSILTAVGMTDELPIMFTAVIVAVVTMLLAADPLANFIARNQSVVMLALGFLADDRDGADRRRVRRARAQGLYLHRNGFFCRAWKHSTSSRANAARRRPTAIERSSRSRLGGHA